MMLKNKWLAVAGAVAAGALLLGAAPAVILQLGLLALCPLMMMFMHGGHGGHGQHGSDQTQPQARKNAAETPHEHQHH